MPKAYINFGWSLCCSFREATATNPKQRAICSALAQVILWHLLFDDAPFVWHYTMAGMAVCKASHVREHKVKMAWLVTAAASSIAFLSVKGIIAPFLTRCYSPDWYEEYKKQIEPI
eukprot:5974930-Amphidinium_carterae.1